MVEPDADAADDDTLHIGDRNFRIYHAGKAHTDGDIMIEVVEEKLLFLGDVGVYERAPGMEDGNFKGSIAAIDIALVGVRSSLPIGSFLITYMDQ